MSASEIAARSNASIGDVVARIERLPVSWWHVKARIIIGVATFFDAFDALAIAFVLPVLVRSWKLGGPQIGIVGFIVGSGLGAVFLVFAAVAVVGAIATGLFAVETKRRVLEDISP